MRSKMTGNYKNKFDTIKLKILFISILCFNKLYSQNITHIYTDYNGFWHSGVGAINNVKIDYSHDLLAFKFNNVIYSTGVNDPLLSTLGFTYSPRIYQALPVVNITVAQGGSRFAQLGEMQDGKHNAVTTIPYPYSVPVKLSDVLSDGVNGLNLGTGITNIQNADNTPVKMEFPFSMISGFQEIGDGIPDILVSQIAQPVSDKIDQVWFEDAAGVRVGNIVSINQTDLPVLGKGMYDFFNPDGTSGGTSFVNSEREIRLSAFDASAFGLNSTNYTIPRKLIYQLGGSSDPAFLSFNYRFLAIVVSNNDNVTTNVNTPITINALANDLIPSAVILNSLQIVPNEGPANGSVVVNANNTVTYTPNPGYIGIDRFRYKICSNTNSCDEAYVNVVVGASDIAVTKTVNPTNPAINSNLTFTVTVTNNGPHNAAGVRVIDLLPVGYTFSSAAVSTNGGSYSSSSGNWIIGDLNVNQSRTLTITATLRSTGPYTNTARASSLMFDPDLSNNAANATPSTVPSAVVSSTCVAGFPVEQVRVTLTGDPAINGWKVNYLFDGVAYTANNVMSSPFIYQPPKSGIFYVTSVTDGNGLTVNYPVNPPMDLLVKKIVYSCQILTNPMLPSKISK